LRPRRWPNRAGTLGPSGGSRADGSTAASRVRAAEDGEGPWSGNKDGLVTRRPLNCDQATSDVGHDAASGRLVHLRGRHQYLVTDFWHESLLTRSSGTSVDQRPWIAEPRVSWSATAA